MSKTCNQWCAPCAEQICKRFKRRVICAWREAPPPVKPNTGGARQSMHQRGFASRTVHTTHGLTGSCRLHAKLGTLFWVGASGANWQMHSRSYPTTPPRSERSCRLAHGLGKRRVPKHLIPHRTPQLTPRSVVSMARFFQTIQLNTRAVFSSE